VTGGLRAGLTTPTPAGHGLDGRGYQEAEGSSGRGGQAGAAAQQPVPAAAAVPVAVAAPAGVGAVSGGIGPGRVVLATFARTAASVTPCLHPWAMDPGSVFRNT
jgi:hypothetical protein